MQLAEGSHLIVDETKLEAGTLNSVGVENARLLKNLMELQKVLFACLVVLSSCMVMDTLIALNLSYRDKFICALHNCWEPLYTTI